MQRALLAVIALAVSGTVSAAAPVKQRLELNSDQIGVLGLPLAESEKPVRRIALTAEVDEKGEGSGVLVLDQAEAPTYDDFGFATAVAPSREIKFDCTLKFEKKVTKVSVSKRLGAPADEIREYRDEWKLYAIAGPKITSQLFLVVQTNAHWQQGRFLVRGADGKVKHVVDLKLPPQPEPCHPGCFPAGTAVRVPGGTTLIERIREGDSVTAVGADGKTSIVKVTGVFATRNRLLEVRTTGATLTTTETQPMALEGGGFRPAGELKAGDRIWRWSGVERRAAVVLEISPASRDSQVFNLVLGDPTTFIAGDFLVRSKPPTSAPRP